MNYIWSSWFGRRTRNVAKAFEPASTTVSLSLLEHGRLSETERLYHELIYAVSMKHDGESRHQTALQYILDAEKNSSQGPACST